MRISARMLAYISILTVLALSIVRLVLSNHLTVLGQTVNEIEEQSAQLQSKNADLRMQIASYSALTVVEKKAIELGFTSKAKVITLWPDRIPVAFNPAQQNQ